MTHCIYYVRPGENEELRYSLRTLAVNGPEDTRVTIIGDPPDWYIGDRQEGNPFQNAEDNSRYNIEVACDLSPEGFFVFNDDFFVLKPWQHPFPLWHNVSLVEHIRRDMKDPRSADRRRRAWNTHGYLTDLGIEEPMHYELHVPMWIDGYRLNALLYDAPLAIKWRTLYGNLAREGQREFREDVKFYRSEAIPDGVDFLSTDERTFQDTGQLVRQFEDPSPWEK